jgi:cysteinyl-tRNA synthetase
MLSLFNTAGRQKMEFVPMNPDGKTVGMYTCGPTVYNYAHIGNLRTYVFEDILKRTLQFNGYNVKHVMNITDVGHLTDDADDGEDKMEKGASREGKSVWDISKMYTQAFKDDLKALNIIEPTVWCKATDHISHQIELVKRLEEKGYTYQLEDGIYFDTSKFPKYADFANIQVDNIRAGARIEMIEGKKNPTDFALWKFSPKVGPRRQMEWDSPWGVGFPGWHIECSAMSMHYLGEQFDIHCGGIDHIPVHHTNEIAQVEAVTGKPWVRFWLHGEFLLVAKNDNEEEAGRMGKSEGNFLTLKVLQKKGFKPLEYRYFLLNAHYRHPLVFTEKAMTSAKNGFKNLVKKMVELKKQAQQNVEVNQENIKENLNLFTEAINDDLNTPRTLAVVWKTIDDKQLTTEEKVALLEKFDEVLGLDLANAKEESDHNNDIPEEVLSLIQKRQEARQNKQWADADELRKQIHDLGYEVLDSKTGATVKKI